MADPYWSGAPWDDSATYAADAQVSYEGYRYQAMTSISAGDNPRTSTYTISGANFRKWKVWDYPASYIMARLRGIPGHAEVTLPQEVRLVQVRADYQYNGDPTADLYLVPTMSAADYGMPQGMNSVWGTPSNGELVWSFSAARYDDGKPASYDYSLGADEGIVFSPTTIMPKARYDGSIPPSLSTFWAFYPAYANETQGQLISCYQTFGRTFNFIDEDSSPDTVFIPAFDDQFNEPGNGYSTNNENQIGDTVGTDPDYKDG